jgi:hypothetical protein
LLLLLLLLLLLCLLGPEDGWVKRLLVGPISLAPRHCWMHGIRLLLLLLLTPLWGTLARLLLGWYELLVLLLLLLLLLMGLFKTKSREVITRARTHLTHARTPHRSTSNTF